MIVRKAVKALQPSILAASSRDFGIDIKYGLSVITINGIEPVVMAIAGAW